MTPTSRRILIVGGGPAGATAAFWLARAGFDIIVAERSTNKFAYGQGIDITGPAVDIVRRMGVYDALRCKATGESGFAILDDASEVIARLGAARDDSGSGFTLTQELEIMRGDVTQILAEAANASARVVYRYGCSVTAISQSSTHITATFTDTGKAEDFAAVIGADGMMSKIRQLAFDPEVTKDCYYGIDQYTAFFSLAGQPEDIPDARLQHASGRRAILIRPVTAESSDRASCYMVYTKYSAELEEALKARRPPNELKSLFAAFFEALPGSMPKRALQGLRDADDFYVAQSAQIRLPNWSNGRIVLSGDAAYAPSPATGQGTALAIVGSYVIAGELAATPNDPIAAFARYEQRLRDYVTKLQKVPLGLAKLVNPETQAGVAVLRFVFWLAAWTGIYKLFNSKSNNKLELPEYVFSEVEVK